jgi:arsenite methyltransferase
MKTINYGVDGPNFIRGLVIGTVSLGLLASLLILFPFNGFTRAVAIICCTGSFLCMLEAFLMGLYAKKGKFTHRDRMLSLIDWQGTESVLDVGSGLGLLLIGAAKRLSSGQAIGIDIWNKDDLTHNSLDQALINAEQEEVGNKVRIKNETIVQTSFQAAYFDVILSNLCLHNISDRQQRQQACQEICRLLKPGGVALISDFTHTKEYEVAFINLGLSVERIGPFYWDTFQILPILKVIKTSPKP